MNRISFERLQKIGGPVILVIFLLLPVLGAGPYLMHLMILSLIYGVLVCSWNLLFGLMGVFSFGHQAFFGTGAYITGLAAMKIGVPPWLCFLLGGAGAALISLVISWPTFRLKGPYLAIVTLAFAEVLRIICSNWVELTRGQLGMSVSPIFLGTTRYEYYYLILAIFVATWVILSKLMQSSWGLAVYAIRESQDAAESLGVNVVKLKRLAFVLTSFMAGIAGAFYAYYIGILTPDILGSGVIFTILVMGLFGGIGTLHGPIIGALALTFLAEYLRGIGDYRYLVYSLIIIFTVLFLPGGMMGGVQKIKGLLVK
jgi:branched-chain amino acid transport system permease protein